MSKMTTDGASESEAQLYEREKGLYRRVARRFDDLTAAISMELNGSVGPISWYVENIRSDERSGNTIVTIGGLVRHTDFVLRMRDFYLDPHMIDGATDEEVAEWVAAMIFRCDRTGYIVAEGSLIRGSWDYEGDEWRIGDRTLDQIVESADAPSTEIRYRTPFEPGPCKIDNTGWYDSISDYGTVRMTIEWLREGKEWPGSQGQPQD
jgi:hypothetical protein